MMRYICILFFTILYSKLGVAQISHDWNDGLMLIKTKEASESNIQGSPFFEDDNFRKGILRISDKAPLDVWLRYDVMNEVMEIKLKPSANEKYKLPLEDDVIYEIDMQKFKADRLRHEGSIYFGYFIEHYNGDNVRLIGKPKLELRGASQPSTGYSDSSNRMKIEEEYFVVWKNGDIEKIQIRHRDIRRLFIKDKSQDYLKEHRIRSIEDFTDFMLFYDRNIADGN